MGSVCRSLYQIKKVCCNFGLLDHGNELFVFLYALSSPPVKREWVASIILPMTPALPVPLNALVFSGNTLDCSDQWRKVHENAAS